MSDQTHFSGPKAVRVAGMRIHTIPAKLLADGNLGITREQVVKAIEEDQKKGLVPCAVLLNYGSTNTCGFDQLADFEGFAQEYNLWLHVDAAYAGASLVLPEFKLESLCLQRVATSFNFNGSKWFLCGFDSAFLFVRDQELLKNTYAATGDYLDHEHNNHIYNPDFKDWSIPLGRRFRALRIWMVLNYYGVTGIQHFLRQAINQANWLRREVDLSEHFEHVVNTSLSLVCIGIKQAYKDKFSWHELLAYPPLGDQFFLTPSKLQGESFLRVAMGGSNTELTDIQQFWEYLLEAVKTVRAG